MSRNSSLPERALEMVMQAVPENAGQWLKTGVTLGALKTGTRVASSIVRRNPLMAAAAAAGAGVLWYVARRQAQRAEAGPIDSTSTRVHARRASAAGSSKSSHGSSGNGSAASERKPARKAPRSRAKKGSSSE